MSRESDPGWLIRRAVWDADAVTVGDGTVPDRADSVVVGGGVMGLSCALFLGRTGRKVVLLERERVGHGASGRNAGLYLPSMAPIEEIGHLLDFLRVEAVDVGFERRGHLALALDDATARRFVEEAERRSESPPVVEVLSREQIEARIDRRLGLEVVAGRWYANGGQINPWLFLAGLVAACRRAGVALLERSAVHRIDETATGFDLTGPFGRIHTRHAVLAAGAWTARLLPSFAARPLVTVRAAQMYATAPDARVEAGPGMATNFGSTYWRVGARGRVIAGGRADLEPAEVEPGAFAVDKTVQHAVADEISRALPRLGDRSARLRWAGSMDVTPDGAPLVGTVDARGLLWVAFGFGGHGLPAALGTGRLVAETLDRRGPAPPSRTDPLRFHTTGQRAYA